MPSSSGQRKIRSIRRFLASEPLERRELLAADLELPLASHSNQPEATLPDSEVLHISCQQSGLAAGEGESPGTSPAPQGSSPPGSIDNPPDQDGSITLPYGPNYPVDPTDATVGDPGCDTDRAFHQITSHPGSTTGTPPTGQSTTSLGTGGGESGSGSEENRPPSDIQLSSTSIMENEPAPAFVGDFTTIDPDGEGDFLYQLVDGDGDTDNSRFEIAGDNLLASETFNFEERSTYSIRVRSTDIDGASIEKTFLISVEDVSEIFNEDVNADSYVTPLDALIVINYLNAHGAGPVPEDQPRLDVNQDLFVTSLDALLVINYLNQTRGAGEGFGPGNNGPGGQGPGKPSGPFVGQPGTVDESNSEDEDEPGQGA